ncbi:ferric reductase-like transmembrane domain-containing protein [Rhodopseudomonas palustris]|nr:ferric reductase-like transmembrane domain-containing protein [Rhodopseudomonas palustris]
MPGDSICLPSKAFGFGGRVTKIKVAWWIIFGLVSTAWLAADPSIFTAAGFIQIRDLIVQYSGLLAMAWMSIALVLAVRPRWPEPVFGGLDKMYRLHKWLGISTLAVMMIHWCGSNAPKWAGAWGWWDRPPRGPHPVLANPIAQWIASFHGAAEFAGEWTFYAVVLLIVVSLLKWFPYRLFFKTHRYLAATYLALVFHAVVLMKFDYWLSTVGALFVPLLGSGIWAAIIVLFRRVGVGHQVRGKIVAMQYFPGVRALKVTIDVPEGWIGHKPGQFVFATSNNSEGAHPYTIASAWNENERRITVIVKELGDHTDRLRETLRVGLEIKIEGPYGCFTFEDTCPDQIWVGGGIGITPFIARMMHLSGGSPRLVRTIHLFHATADYDEDALANLAADAEAAGVHLHVMVDERDGKLSGERIRAIVPAWRRSSIWFCGPVGLGQGLRRDFASAGMAVDRQFHQEMFAMR